MVLNALKTELEALNEVLENAGEDPVNGLTGMPRSGARALRSLRSVNAQMQADTSFWHNNGRRNVTLNPDSITSKIALGANVVSVSASRRCHDVTNRGGFLFDIENDTDLFTSSIEVNMKILLEWDELNVQNQWYFIKVASRLYQQRWLVNDKRHNYNLADEQQARGIAVSANNTEAKISILDHPTLARYNNRNV